MFRRLSLQSRFLIAPIIGVILALAIFLSSKQVIEEQKLSFQTISEANLVEISEITIAITSLNNSNSQIITLLLKAESMDEEEFYESGKKHLNKLYQIESSLNQITNNREILILNDVDIFPKIQEAYSDFRYQTVSAIEMASVDLSAAGREVVLASEKLHVLNDLFLALSNHYKNQLQVSSEQVENSLRDSNITELAIGLICLMILTAIYFSKNVASRLDQVYKALNRLAKGNTSIEIPKEGDDYLDSIWKSVAEFRDARQKNKEYQNDLLMQKYAMDQHSIIAATDIKGTITYVNQKFSDISGYSKTELLGQNHRILNSGARDKSYWRNMYLTVSKGNSWHDEILNKTKDGQLYWVDTTIVPMRSPEDPDKITGYLSIRTDITDKKAQRDKLVEAKIEAESAALAKSQFLATMSHEIRTPMNGVLGMLRLSLNDALEEKQRERIEVALNSAQSLLSLINDILDFSKVDAGKLDIEHIDFNLLNLLDEVEKTMKLSAEQKNLSLIFDNSKVFVSLVKGDPGRVRQVLNNLISNAIKFTEQGEIRVKSSIIETENDFRLKCSVSDQGIGIPRDKIGALFESFSQVDASTTRKYGGTGLGLAISKKLCELMGGSIAVESKEGQGSTFHFGIRLDKSSKPCIEQDTKSMPESALNSSNEWPADTKILIVEDNQINQLVIQSFLSNFGLNFETANNGKEALKLLDQDINKTRFNLILMDCQMPILDGYDTTKEIRSNIAYEPYADIPIIALTANVLKEDRQKCLSAGMTDYLPKPLEAEDLLSKLHSSLI
jgi:PAS domain S-box-containing protein